MLGFVGTRAKPQSVGDEDWQAYNQNYRYGDNKRPWEQDDRRVVEGESHRGRRNRH